MARIVPRVEGMEICNFEIEVHRKLNVHTDSQEESIPQAEISLVFKKGDPTNKTRIPLSQLESIDWKELDYRATLTTKIPASRANRFIANDICSVLDNFPTTEVYRLGHPGMYIIRNEPVFCTGDGVIRPSFGAIQRPEVECEAMPQRLDFDPDLSEDEAAAEMFNLISLSPTPGRVILSQVLVSLLRQAYEDAGKRPSFCVFLHGLTGTQKTTIASFLTQIYNRSEGITVLPRLNASQASAVELLLNVSDQVQVFDDLFPSASASIRKKQEETLSEITRYIGDGTVPARIKGNNVRSGHPRCGVLFTGEYAIGEGSDAARLLLVEMTKPDTSALSYFQNRSLIVSTFYRNFITWFVNNYGEIVSYLKDWRGEYCKADLGVHDRLRETHFFLNTAYSLLLEYCGEKGVLKEADVMRFHRCFVEMLTQLIREQNERVSPTPTVSPTSGNALERIRELYRSGQLSIPDTKRKFDPNHHDGILHTGCLCLYPKALSRFFPSRNIEEVATELDTQGVLSKGRNGLKKKISETGGKYFYCIPLILL